MTKHKTYYEILEIEENAATEIVAAAYKRLARQYHPDYNKAVDATHKMQEINEAYEILKDQEKRAIYDKRLVYAPVARGSRIRVYRTGAPVGVLRKMRVYLNKKRIGEIAWGKGKEFLITPGQHAIYVKMDGGRSKAMKFHCGVDETVEIACGANSALGSLMASIFTPNDIFFINVIRRNHADLVH